MAQLTQRLREAVSFWSRSLLIRVVVVTLAFSLLAILAIGWFLQSQITKRLLDAKQQVAIAEVAKAADTVRIGLANADSDPTALSQQVNLTLTDLSNPGRTSGAQGPAGFEPVITYGAEGFKGKIEDVPADLVAKVAAGFVAVQPTTIWRSSTPGTDEAAATAVVQVPALVVGSPVYTGTDRYAVYLIFRLDFEQSTVAVVQNTLLLGGLGLAVVLALIAGLVALQVVRPIRRAAAVAGRLAAGDLAERMPVRGPVELTTLARSFNGMADAIRAQIRQLEEFGKLQRRFTSDVSHELRTPVTTVRMAADYLHDSRDELPAHLSRSTELLVAELDRFESLLADLLEISRHDAGMAELAAEQIDVRGVVENVVRAADGLSRKAGVRLNTVIPDEPVIAEIDNRRLERILRNLVNNAIDHAESAPVEIELAADDKAVAVTVTDHGVGLKPGEAGLVFNRFWRADASRQRQTGGTGLGLAISLEDARLHGGWLQASGHPGQGARFRLTLPRVKGELIESSPLPLRIDGDEDPQLPQDDRRLTDRLDDPLALFTSAEPAASGAVEADR